MTCAANGYGLGSDVAGVLVGNVPAEVISVNYSEVQFRVPREVYLKNH